ncbi:MAG: radical SAM protein [Candidatus Woesearchaeota archaeon]
MTQKTKKTAIVFANSQCNTQCNHCYVPLLGERDPGELVDIVHALQAQDFAVTIAGTETLLNPGYLDAYQAAGQHYLLTNGLLLLQQPDLFERMHNKGIDDLRISLHFGIHELLGCVPESQVREAIELSQKEGFKVVLNTVIADKNYQYADGMCQEAKAIGMDGIHFIRYLPIGRGEFLSGVKTLTPEQRVDFFNIIMQARAVLPKKDLEIVIHGNFGPRRDTKGEIMATRDEYCPAGREQFVITPDNIVYPCPFFMNTSIGVVDDTFTVRVEPFNVLRTRCLISYASKGDFPGYSDLVNGRPVW